MAIPTIKAIINFSTGPSFAQAFIIGSGVLGTNILADSASVIVDVSNQVSAISTKRGRSPESDQFQTGTLSLKIVDTNGDFNPQNTASPYYGLLSPMRKVQISATYGSTTYNIFSGYITSYNTVTPQFTGDVSFTTITAVDAFRLAQNAQISTVTGATAGELSGARIGNILNTISWPTSQRSIDAGQTTMQADPGTARTALGAMQTVETSEYGALYVDRDNNFVFKDRKTATTSVNQTAVKFNDNGTDIKYNNAVWIFNDALVYNKADITMNGGTTQNATNTASVAKYFLHSYNQQGLLMQTDAVALDYARAYCASRAETTVRCDAITLDLYTENYTAGTIAALDLDYFDPVTITTTQPGAGSTTSTLTKTLQVFGVAMEIKTNSWKVTLTTLEPIIDGFLLGVTDYDVLGTTTMSY
jgi:hypothetical protein